MYNTINRKTIRKVKKMKLTEKLDILMKERDITKADMFDKLPYSDKVKYLQEIVKECVWDGKNLFITV